MKQQARTSFFIIGGAIFIGAVIIGSVYIEETRTPETLEPTFLYIQTASSGSLVQDGEKLILTLHNVSPQTIYFADRPGRETGREPTGEFIDRWDDGRNSLADNPPNAALHVTDEHDVQHVLVIEILDAEYYADTNTLMYDVIVLDPPTESPIAFSYFKDAALFLDSTSKSYHCTCYPEPGETCECEYSYSLHHSTTKEFRGSCRYSRDGNRELHITDRHDDTTCTIQWPAEGYISQSCTNWSISNNDNLTIRVSCTHEED